MPYHRGDVVLVPFPFSDAPTTKKRPAIVLTTDRFNAGNLDVLVCGITHSPHAARRPGAVKLTDAERKAGGLDADPLMAVSIAVASKLATIAQIRVVTTLGRLPADTVDQLVEALLAVVCEQGQTPSSPPDPNTPVRAVWPPKPRRLRR